MTIFIKNYSYPNNNTIQNNKKEFDTSLKSYKLTGNQVYITYKVKKGDTITKLLKKFGAYPIYGKQGYLSKTLELNPLKKETKGNLIYPKEYITLPIPINRFVKFSKFDKSEYSYPNKNTIQRNKKESKKNKFSTSKKSYKSTKNQVYITYKVKK